MEVEATLVEVRIRTENGLPARLVSSDNRVLEVFCAAQVRDVDNEEALIESVVENPDDDVALMVYADWLDERGDLRGRFLRLTLENANNPPSDKLEKRARKLEMKSLLRRIDSDWLKRLGFVARDLSLFDATQVAYRWLHLGQYGSRQKAIRALANRQAYLGFGSDDVRQDFETAVAIQQDIRQYVADLRRRGQPDSLVANINPLREYLRGRHHELDQMAIICAIGMNVTTWHQL